MNFYSDIDKYGDNIAIITSKEDYITYSQLTTEADKLSQRITNRCLVFNLCDNSEESIVGYVSFLKSRVVQVLLNYSIQTDMLEQLVKKYMPCYIWTLANRADSFSDYKIKYEYKNYVLLEIENNVEYDIYDELALLLTTSGSTGSPKFVRQSYKNINSNAYSISKYLNIKTTDRPITTLPMSYTYGLSIINTHLLNGCSIIVTNKTLMDKEFWQLLKENKATTFGGVPYIYEMLKKLKFDRMALPSLKILTQAGGKLSPELSREFSEMCQSKGIQFIVMYGQAEATARMGYLPQKYAITKAGSMGIAIPGGEFIIQDEEGNSINDPDIVGELVYKGENVTLGYAESYRDLSLGDMNRGILKTGDMVKKDSDGFYYIVGRKKRFLKIFGNRINLDEIEGLLKKQEIESVCGGEDDKLKIYITNSNDEERVREFVINHLEISLAGFEVKIIDKIPRNDAGKVLYSVLEKR